MSEGRPPFEPNADQRRTVRAMAAYGIPHHAIAEVIGISGPTLRKHFRIELDTAEAEANAKVAETLFRRATGEGPQSVTAAIFWLKCRAGWREFDVVPANGKKAEAEQAAKTAGVGTEWGDDLRSSMN